MKQELLKQKCIISTAEIDESQKWVKEIKLLIKEFQKKKLRELKEAKRKEEVWFSMVTGGCEQQLF